MMMTNSELLALYGFDRRSEAVAFIQKMMATGVEPREVQRGGGGDGSVMRLESPNHDRHGFAQPVVMVSFPRPYHVSGGGDSIRDAEAGRGRSYGDPIRVYYDAAAVEAVS